MATKRRASEALKDRRCSACFFWRQGLCVLEGVPRKGSDFACPKFVSGYRAGLIQSLGPVMERRCEEAETLLAPVLEHLPEVREEARAALQAVGRLKAAIRAVLSVVGRKEVSE